MARPKRPWFRFYCEALHDRKLRRLKPAHRWLWVAVLACARQSPIPGFLLVEEHEPTTVDDLADDAALKASEVKAGMAEFVKIGMVTIDPHLNAWHVTKWHERQYESDSSAGRTQRYRERHGDDDSDDPSDGGSGVTTSTEVTSPPRARGTDTEADTSPDGDGSEAPPAEDGKLLSIDPEHQHGDSSSNGQAEDVCLLDRTASWLIDQHGVEFASRENLHGTYDDVLRAAVDRVPDERVHHTAMGLVCEYAERVNGEKLPSAHRQRVGRMLKAHLPDRVLYGVAEAMDWSGLKPEHVDNPDAWMNYATTVVKKLEAAKESA